jgi:hypothetical protein
MSSLKAEAFQNMKSIVLTPEVSHAPMSWSKTEAPKNIPAIDATPPFLPEVSHAPMSWSKAEA